MPKIATKCMNLAALNDGGPARKLSAAARAVMEPVEARVMMSVSALAAAANQQVSAITAKAQTDAMPDAGQSAGGTTIWVNPADASQSRIIAANKKLGGLAVYDVSGHQTQFFSIGHFLNVDVRNNVALNGQNVTLVAADNTDTNSIDLFTIDATTGQLSLIGNTNLTVSGNVDGLAMYQSVDTADTFVFVSTSDGSVEQIQIGSDGNGGVAGTSVRTISLGSAAQGLVADDSTGALYVSQDGVAIWKYGAEPTDGSVRVEIDSTAGNMDDSAEQLAMYNSSDGTGYLIASRQDTNDYAVYDRQTGAFVTSFNVSAGDSIDGTQSSDSIAAVSGSINSSMPGGMFVAEDDQNDGGNQNFKIVSWSDIASAQSVPLAIDSGQNADVALSLSAAAVPVSPTEALLTATPFAARSLVAKPAAVTAPDLTINSLQLYEAQSNNRISTLHNGDVIDLADYDGTPLNIRAAVDSSPVGSVNFSINGRMVRTENASTYDLAGTDGIWSPTVGTYTVSATAFSASHAAGTSGDAENVTFTVIDSSKSTPTSGSTSTSKPASPAKLTATSGSTSKVSLAWSESGTVTGYYVERSTDDKTFSRIATTTGTSYMNSSLAASTTYYYRVQAYNAAGTSGYSSVASATTVTDASDVPSTVVTSLSGQPSATNTGVKSGTKLTTVDGFIGKSNTTYSNLLVNGMVNLQNLSNVTLINCVIDGGSSALWGVRSDGATNIKIENCEIRNTTMAAVYGDNFSVINSYIHKIEGDGFKPRAGCLIQGNYVTDLGYGDPNAHADGVQVSGGSNIRITGNFFNMPLNVANTKSNSSMFLQGTASNVVFSGNWCLGGNFTIHAFADGSGGPSVKITGNTFYADSSQYGYGQIADDVVWSTNVTNTGLVALAMVS